MIDKLIHYSIQNKLIIGLLVLVLIGWGSYSATQLPIDAVPDITNNQVQVITIAPSIASQEVERLITFPVELTMATIPGIEEIRSFSRFGLSVVTIVFEEDIDVYWARQQVNERLGEAKSQIPRDVGTPEMAPVTTGLGEIYQYVLHPKKGYEDMYSPMELRSIQDWIIKRQLLGTEGVADVSSFGGNLKQYEIAIDPGKLRSMNVSIAAIFTALETNNQNTGGAYIDKKPNAFFIRSEGLVGSLEDIENIVVKRSAAGMPVLIKDLAQVQLGTAIRYGASTRNGEGEVVSAVVMMLKGENSAKVIANIKEKIEQISKTLPEGLVIEPFLDRSRLVKGAINTVSKNLIEGALIVLFILILLLGNVRAGMVVASVIPLAMLFAFGMMRLFGVSGNLMSLGAIDFGLIVDGAVIIVESIVHSISKSMQPGIKLSRNNMDKKVYEAASRIRSSAAFGEIIILIVYLPILALVGVEGKMFKPMAQTVSFAILGAFLLSLTYVPMMSALFLSRKAEKENGISVRLMNFFHRLYTPVLNKSLKWDKMVITGALILFGLAFFIFKNMGGEFIPTLNEGDFAIETRVMTGSSISETIEISGKAEKLLLENFPEVEQVVGKIGSGEIPTDPMPVEACDLMVILKDRDEWTSAETREELAGKMSQVLATIPGVTFGFQQPIQMRFNELMTGARQDVVIKIYGEDLDQLSVYGKEVGALLHSIEGAEDVYIEQITGLPQIRISFNRGQIAKYGLSIQEVNETIEMAFAGKSAGKVYEGERSFDLVVRYNEENRQDLDDVSRLFITSPDGFQVPLEQLAEISFREGPNQIQRDDTRRRITVGFNVRNRDVESVVEEIKTRIEESIDFLPGYYPTYGGQFRNLVEARSRLAVAVPVALLLIFILLFFTFRSIKQALLIFTAIPFAAIGGVFALYLRDMPFSISAGVGFIALFGVAVLNGIVLIGEFNRLKKAGVSDAKERVKQGTRIRLRPVLMTALVASFGFLPMALSGSSGAEVQRPLATVVIGGLVTATLLTLIVLPILYIYFEKNLKMKNKRAIMPLLLALVLFPAQAQTDSAKRMSLHEIIQVSLDNHPSIKNAELEVTYKEQQKRASFDPGKTQLNWQHGQYNSYNRNDNYFGLNQTFAFPTYYQRNSQLAGAEVNSSRDALNMSINDLVSRVKTAYYNLSAAMVNLEQLRGMDSILSRLQRAVELQFETGEISMLEKTSADTRSMEIRNLISIAESDVAYWQICLQSLMNLEALPLIEYSNAQKATLSLASDSLSLAENPGLAFMWSQIELQENALALERSKLMPDINIGYFNQSLIGDQTIDGQNRYFGPEYRFTGFQVGLAIPLYARPQVARIEAAQTRVEMAAASYEQWNNEMKGLLAEAVTEYYKYKASLDYYEQFALKQADLLIKTAQTAYLNGSSDFSTYYLALEQGLKIKTNYVLALNQYNQSIVRIEYLTGNQY